MKHFALRCAIGPAFVVAPEDRPGFGLRFVGEKKPITVPPGQIYGRVSPCRLYFRRRRKAGLPIGIVRRGKTKVTEAEPSGIDHFVQGG